MDRIIVSRHRADIEFIARELGGTVCLDTYCVRCSTFIEDEECRNCTFCGGTGYVREISGSVQIEEVLRCTCCGEPQNYCQNGNDPVGGPAVEEIEILTSATAKAVNGKVVYGALPMHLAAEADCVYAIEFAGAAPRGTEYTLADMDAAGARLVPYVVLQTEQTR